MDHSGAWMSFERFHHTPKGKRGERVVSIQKEKVDCVLRDVVKANIPGR